MKNDNKKHITYLRALACFLVILVHVSATQYSISDLTTSGWLILNTYNCIGIWGVPLFVMISGALLLSSTKENMISYTIKKACNLFFIYFFCLFTYNLIAHLRYHNSISSESFKDEVLLNTLLSKGCYHTWFLPMLAVLYIATPFLKEIVRNKALVRYYIILYCVFSLLFPQILNYEFPYKRIVSSIYSMIPFLTFGSYLGYFLLGYYVETFSKTYTKTTRYIIYICSALSLLCAIVSSGFFTYQTSIQIQFTNTPYSIFCFIGCFGIYLLFKYLFEENKKNIFILEKASELSLGIYLVHPFIISIFTDLNINFITPIQTFCILIASGVLWWTLHSLLRLFILIVSKLLLVSSSQHTL
ncbi:MAG: acyltransferase [Lachnospiraceae bacterium]